MSERAHDQAGGYPTVESQPNFPRIEERILDRWEREGTFFTSIAQREDLSLIHI